MRSPIRPAFAGILLLLGACTSNGPDRPVSADPDRPSSATQTDANERPDPSLIALLPATFESFDFEGFRHFDQADTGFTVRYSNPRKRRFADLYVYPVAEENRRLAHDQLVMGSTRATLKAIGRAVARGVYANFNVVGTATHARGVRTVARVETTYLRENLASYSLLYQTEYNGTLVKVRVTMPDNESNRRSREWDRFALAMLDTVIEDIDGQNSGLPAPRPPSV